MDDGRLDDAIRNVHSAQLRFVRKSVPIGVGISFLKINALRDFQILHRRITILDNRGNRFRDKTCNSSWREEPACAKGSVGIH